MPTGAAPRAFKPPAGLPVFVDHSVGEEEVSIQAMSLVGVPYRWGGNTPDSGFDCSGLVRYVVARAARVDLPRTTADMSLVGNSIEPDEVAPGDLIFFNTTGRPHSHVGIYVGGYRFVNAPSTGGTVRIDYISNPYWAKRFDGIRRVASTNKPSTPFDAPRIMTSTEAEPTTSRSVTQAQASTEEPVAASSRTISQSPTTAQAGADAFEPPPPSRSAAESQAAAEHASAVDPIAAFAGSSGEGANHPAENSSAAPREEPRDGRPEAGPARLSGVPAPADDPIARFATGG